MHGLCNLAFAIWAHYWQLPADAFCLDVGAEIMNSVAFGLELGALKYEQQEDGTVKLAALPMLQVLLSNINPMMSSSIIMHFVWLYVM